MTYYQTHTWDRIDRPVVTGHDGRVHLHESQFSFDHGHGYSLSFEPRHLPILRELVHKLEKVEAAKEEAAALEPQSTTAI